MRCLCSFGVRVRVPASSTLWMWDFPWISSNPLWSSQLKYPSFSFWIWWVFAGSLGTVDYSNGVFNILVSSLGWDLFSASFSWVGQGEIFAVQFISWNFSPVQFLWTNKGGCRFLLCYFHPSPHSLFVLSCLLCSPGQFSKPDQWNWFVWGFLVFFEITHFSVPALSAKISPAIR